MVRAAHEPPTPTRQFDSVAELTDAINEWTSHWNNDAVPFVGRKPADEIITRVRRGRAALKHPTASATDH